MRVKASIAVIVGVILLVISSLILSRIPNLSERLAWRFDRAETYVRSALQQPGELPSPVAQLAATLPPPEVAVTRRPNHPVIPPLGGIIGGKATPTQVPLPQSIALPAPGWEKQDINNCGPATLTMYLRYYGWDGNQKDVADEVKPQRDDRNVNVEELAYFVRTQVGWLEFEYRVGGDLRLLKELLAAGIPVMVEESFYFDNPYWPNDDLWAAHYNLITGYDEASHEPVPAEPGFTSQDSFHGPDQKVGYAKLDEYWHVFNRVYILVYPPEKKAVVQSILGADWDADTNRQRALETAKSETETNPQDAFAWFNLGTNLVYFERYSEAATAYDKAREIGLPQRMLRYQFGPFIAYFQTSRLDDLLALTDYALKRTPNSEEAMLWRGWAFYRQGKLNDAVDEFQSALAQNPNYQDARYALNFVWTGGG